MHQIIYMSSIVEPHQHIIQAIVATSLKHNKRDEITGMMLYSDGDIVQAIEGKKKAVQETFARILVDMRHVGIQVLIDEKTERREFSCWSFGFKSMKKSEIQKWNLEGDVFKARDEELDARIRRGNALAVFKSFAK
jgi:hypothetical protein